MALTKTTIAVLVVAAIMVLAAIVVPSVLFTRGDDSNSVSSSSGGGGGDKEAGTSTTSSLPTMNPTVAPTTEGFWILVDFIQEAFLPDPSYVDFLTTPGNPQYQALSWMASDDTYLVEMITEEEGETNGTHIFDSLTMENTDLTMKFIQRFVMATVLFSLERQDMMNAGRDECNWRGTRCDGRGVQGIITEINLPPPRNDDQEEELSTTKDKILAGEMAFLRSLKHFAAPGNSIGLFGLQYAFQASPNLESIDLSNNRIKSTDVDQAIRPGDNNNDNNTTDTNSNTNIPTISIEDVFGNLPNLTSLDLSNNLLEGNFPSNVLKVKRIDLSGNQGLNGTIPWDIVGNFGLHTLRLAHTNVSLGDSIPTDLKNYSHLMVLDMSHTNVGTFPTQLFQFQNLTEFNFANAQMMGTIPEEIVQWNYTLMDLFLQNNQLSGRIPVAFDHLTALETLHIQGNKLTGSITAAVCSERGLRFQQLATLETDCVIECMCCDVCEP